MVGGGGIVAGEQSATGVANGEDGKTAIAKEGVHFVSAMVAGPYDAQRPL
ncbi:MAG: hypothetical protein ACYS9T_12320 [Planctomycetota bacterium]